VPTGIDFGPDGSVYVSALTGEAPGEGRVYKLSPTGRLLRTYTGFTGPTGVAVGPDGAIYVSELFHGAPAGPPPPGFDPADIGRIVRVGPSGKRTYADVTMPLGLEVQNGRLYATAWSVAAFLGIPNAGQVVVVWPQAFHD
jgi:DNA-binding beta-propeller fold protein YncE